MMQRRNSTPTFVLKLLFVAFSAIALSASTYGQKSYTLDGPLPVDPAITVGQLDNGLRYYIRANEKPDNRVSMRLVVNAGSLQEDEGQRGLAHFVEHLAFNGTKRFEKQEIVNFMERVGMRFGADVNAYTSRNETVYMLELPTEDQGVIDIGFQILRDWAADITFDPYEIDAERGVIVEEWRLHQDAQNRIQELQYPYIYYDSRYADRDPIGSMVVVRNAPPVRFTDFYEKWYRPNLMAVIVVGDVDREEIEKRIGVHFGDLVNPENEVKRELYEVPDHEETLYSIEADPELTVASMQILFKQDPAPDQSALDYRNYIVRNLFLTMLNGRLYEARRVADPPFLSASVGYTRMAREKALLTQSVVFVRDEYQRGIEAMMAEINRALNDGFTASEFERAKADLLRSIERANEENGKTDSNVYAREYTRAFTVDEPIPGIAIELELNRDFMADMKLEEVEKMGEGFKQTHSRVVLFSAPENETITLPEEEELVATIETAQKVELQSYDDDTLDQPLLAEKPQGSVIVEEKYHEEVDTHEWSLANGIRILAKQTDFKNDQILVGSFSPGGHSLVMDDEHMSAAMATSLMSESGYGGFDSFQLEKKLAGKVVSVSPYIGDIYEGLQGSASPKDLETFFQLLYLQITQPQLNDEAISSLRSRLRVMLENRRQSPETVFQEALENMMFGDHPRHRPLDEDRLSEIDPELSLAVFKDRFADFGDFTFVFVGSMDLDELKKMTTQYLGALPTYGRVEKGRFLDDSPLKGTHELSVEKGLENKTTVRVIMSGEAEWSPENRYALQVARDLISIRMRETLREKQGGTYGVSVFGGITSEPVEQFTTGFGFSCDPRNTDILIQLGLAVIDDVAKNGPRLENVAKIKEIHLRSYEEGMQENGFWLRNLLAVTREDRPLEDILSYHDLVKNLDLKKVQLAADLYFQSENKITAKLVPGEN